MDEIGAHTKSNVNMDAIDSSSVRCQWQINTFEPERHEL